MKEKESAVVPRHTCQQYAQAIRWVSQNEGFKRRAPAARTEGHHTTVSIESNTHPVLYVCKHRMLKKSKVCVNA